MEAAPGFYSKSFVTTERIFHVLTNIINSLLNCSRETLLSGFLLDTSVRLVPGLHPYPVRFGFTTSFAAFWLILGVISAYPVQLHFFKITETWAVCIQPCLCPANNFKLVFNTSNMVVKSCSPTFKTFIVIRSNKLCLIRHNL